MGGGREDGARGRWRKESRKVCGDHRRHALLDGDDVGERDAAVRQDARGPHKLLRDRARVCDKTRAAQHVRASWGRKQRSKDTDEHDARIFLDVEQ